MPRVAALVSGFGRFIKADGPTKSLTDLRAFRCQIALDSIHSIPQNLSVIIGEELFHVLVHLERWERNDDGGVNAPPGPPRQDQDEAGAPAEGRNPAPQAEGGVDDEMEDAPGELDQAEPATQDPGPSRAREQRLTASSKCGTLGGSLKSRPAPEGNLSLRPAGRLGAVATTGRGPATGRCSTAPEACHARRSRTATKAAQGSRKAESNSIPASCTKRGLDQRKGSVFILPLSSSVVSSGCSLAGTTSRRKSCIYCEVGVPDEPRT